MQIVELVQGIDRRGTNSTAHDCLDIIRRICAYAVQLEIRETSPAAHLKDILPKKASEPMRHVIAPDDIGRILLTLERAPTLTPAVKAYVRLMPLLFTRPDELRTMRWEELDLNAALWTKPAHTMKKRRVHLIPLPRQALAIIEALRIHTGHLPAPCVCQPDHGQAHQQRRSAAAKGAQRPARKNHGSVLGVVYNWI